MNTIKDHRNTYYYQAIRDYYEDKSAQRSRLPYMNHIDEGIVIFVYILCFKVMIS
jgi:hypothetical protein